VLCSAGLAGGRTRADGNSDVPDSGNDDEQTGGRPVIRVTEDRIGLEGFAFGLVADVHHADKEPAGARHYRRAKQNLVRAMDAFEQSGVAFVVQLGDLIDGGADGQAERQLDEILPVFERVRAPAVHVVGNHDFGGVGRDAVLRRFGLDRGYYRFAVGGVEFAVLDSLDVAVSGGWGRDSDHYRRGRRMLDALRGARAANALDWNGGVGPEQRRWLRGVLDEAVAGGRRVIVFSHIPLEPEGEKHTLWNATEVAGLLEACPAVEAVFCGHRHAERFARRGGVHYVTLEAMVEVPDDSTYAIVRVRPEGLAVDGHGRMRSKVLPRKVTAGRTGAPKTKTTRVRSELGA